MGFANFLASLKRLRFLRRSRDVEEALRREIAERRQVEQTLREAELKMRLLTQSANDAIISADENGHIITWNRGAEVIFQYTPREALGQPLTLLMPARYYQAHNQGFTRYIAGQGGVSLGKTMELQGRRKDGNEFPLELSLSDWTTPEGRFVGAILRDISARKQAETALAQAKEAAEAANRAKSEFLANMSHELRTPLNAILGFAQLMNRTDNRSPDDRENLETIITSGEHLLALINDVLEMSKIEAGRSTLHEQNLDLSRMLADLADMFHLRAAEKGLALHVERDPAVPPYIRTDERKLRQVLINLLGNAIKFTTTGSVWLKVFLLTEPTASAPPSNDRGLITLYFEVGDTGPGIPPEEQAGLFQAFSQTSSGRQMQEGTGLGLAVSRQFVQLMGGDITLQSSGLPGAGATFAFDIRVEQVEAAEAPPPQRRVVGLAPGQPPYRILAVEDKDMSRRLLVKLLEPLGLEVRDAVNGQQAVDIFETWQPHLIWMDMRMPVMDGYEATRRIRASTKGQAPVIIALTASAFEEERIVVLSAGCDDFVRKPFNELDLFDKMTEYLGVQFEYEEVSGRNFVSAGRAESPESLKSKIQNLKSNWLAEFHHAAARAQSKTLLDLIAQIQPNQPDLAATLTEMVHNFEFEKLKMLVESPSTR